MRPRILTYMPQSGGRKRSKHVFAVIRGHKDTIPASPKPIKQYRRRMLPYISPDLRWMCLWMALLLAVILVMSVIDAGSL